MRMSSFERNGYIVEKQWQNQPGGYRVEEAGPRITLGGSSDGKAYVRQSPRAKRGAVPVFPEHVYRVKVGIKKEVEQKSSFEPMWLSKACCDDECACVANYGCQCEHDCQCPDRSLPHTKMSMTSDSLAINLHKYARSTETHVSFNLSNVKLEGGTYQEPNQVGFFESDEPGIDEPEDAVDAGSLRKGGGAAWARAHGREPDWERGGDWKHPRHWIRPEERPTEHRGYKIPGHLTGLELNINPGHRQIAAGRFKYIYSKETV